MIRTPPPIALLGWAVAFAALASDAAAAQEEEARVPTVRLAAWAGFSLREGQATLRFADDLVEFGARLAWDRGAALHPWVQIDRFERPDLNCVPGIPCNADGLLLRGGVLVPLSEDHTTPGLHPSLLAGIGAGFSTETELAYLLGFGLAWRLHPRLAPGFEARWERVPGLRAVAVVAAGLELGLF